MTCSNKGCKIKAKINTRTGLCPGCEEFFQGVNRRVDHLDRRHQARDRSHDARRNLDGNHAVEEPATNQPPGNNLVNFPPASAASMSHLPSVDLNEIIKSCEAAKNGDQVDTGKVLGDMMGMIVHMFAKQSENDAIKEQVHSNTDKIACLEAKVGDSNEVAYARSVAIRKLPLPPLGVTELQNVQHFLKEIKAEGFNADRDCIKAIRKESLKHNPNLGPNLGTVLVELKNEEVRGKIMKTKKNLIDHPAAVLRSLIIKNAMSPTEMKAQNTNFGLLKMITGNDDFYIAGNGAIRKKDPAFNHYQAQPPYHPIQQLPRHQLQHAHVHPQPHLQQHQGVPRFQAQQFLPPQPKHNQGFTVPPPPQPSQMLPQQGYVRFPQSISKTVNAPQPIITRYEPISEADLLGDFDFSAAHTSAEPRTRSAGHDLPNAAFDQTQPGTSHQATQPHENLTHQ